MIRLQGITHNFGLKSFLLMQSTLMLSSKSLKTLGLQNVRSLNFQKYRWHRVNSRLCEKTTVGHLFPSRPSFSLRIQPSLPVRQVHREETRLSQVSSARHPWRREVRRDDCICTTCRLRLFHLSSKETEI